MNIYIGLIIIYFTIYFGHIDANKQKHHDQDDTYHDHIYFLQKETNDGPLYANNYQQSFRYEFPKIPIIPKISLDTSDYNQLFNIPHISHVSSHKLFISFSNEFNKTIMISNGISNVTFYNSSFKDDIIDISTQCKAFSYFSYVIVDLDCKNRHSCISRSLLSKCDVYFEDIRSNSYFDISKLIYSLLYILCTNIFSKLRSHSSHKSKSHKKTKPKITSTSSTTKPIQNHSHATPTPNGQYVQGFQGQTQNQGQGSQVFPGQNQFHSSQYNNDYLSFNKNNISPPPMANNHRYIYTPSSYSPYTTSIYILCVCMISGVTSCDSFLPMGSGMMTTMYELSQGVVNTSFTGYQSIFMPSEMHKVCMPVSDDYGLLGTIEIEIKNYRIQTQSELSYYTSNWTGVSFCRERMHRAEGSQCGTGERYSCSNIVPTDGDMNNEIEKTIHKDVLEAIGESYCYSAGRCGNLLKCGTYGYDNSFCYYGRAGIVPIGDIATVKKVINTRLEYDIDINFRTKDSTTRLKVERDNPKADINIRISETGDISNTANIVGQHFVLYMGHTYLARAAENKMPQSNAIGDIQAEEKEHLLNRVQNKISLPGFSLWSISKVEGGGHANFVSQGINSIGQFPKDVVTVGNHIWTASNEEWTTTPTLHNPMNIVLEFTKNISFARTVSMVCPVVISSYSSADGCRSCSRGSSVVINAMSNCSSGYVKVINTNGKVNFADKTIILDTHPRNYTLVYHTDLELVEDNICLQIVTVTSNRTSCFKLFQKLKTDISVLEWRIDFKKNIEKSDNDTPGSAPPLGVPGDSNSIGSLIGNFVRKLLASYFSFLFDIWYSIFGPIIAKLKWVLLVIIIIVVIVAIIYIYIYGASIFKFIKLILPTKKTDWLPLVCQALHISRLESPIALYPLKPPAEEESDDDDIIDDIDDLNLEEESDDE
ncbi:hypothetical protein PPL_03503 (plasmid) [Heterostelium pallidum]|uniref:Uncharacterized protein n=1 Tax=Heterostelium pallidum (strain ATCC 26659 / Pp 5 / PN500) TaxID=670386 RepID=D3EMR1_HETP5|nr:hypothetical protein PPL_03503 [Heterostelium pallidum]ADC31710.1 hypothetical protein PPL_03503 [Heterostelium pallidum]|eukprot:YP_003422574.1 hypothetical protein PPL_03503 (plasmid) [Heterostelium pallidum]